MSNDVTSMGRVNTCWNAGKPKIPDNTEHRTFVTEETILTIVSRV